MSPEPPDSSLPARLRGFHARRRPPECAPRAPPDDWLLYLPRHAAAGAGALARRVAGVPRAPPPARRLLPPRVPPPRLAGGLPAEVMAWLNRVFLYAATRTMRAGRQIQVVVDALDAAGIPSVLLKGRRSRGLSTPTRRCGSRAISTCWSGRRTCSRPRACFTDEARRRGRPFPRRSPGTCARNSTPER